MVHPHHGRPALEVEPLQLGLEALDLVEELERHAERVPHAQRAAHAEMVTVHAARHAAAPGEIGLDQVEVVVRADAEGEALHADRVGAAEDERMVHPLLPAAQVEGFVGARRHDQPQQVDVEPSPRRRGRRREAPRRRRA